ncbi:MAG: FkbM family methyltransferase [Ruminococcus sp.]|nr:FkbM family methyltransferase [Ruminococcus sp.]
MDLFKKMVEELKNETLPVMIYGTKAIAKIVTDYLDQNSIGYTGHVLDDEYYVEGMTVNGRPVYPLNSYISKNKCVIVVAFTQMTQERENELRAAANVKQLYALDFLGKGALDNTDGQITEKFYEDNKDKFIQTRQWLCDEASVAAFDAYIDQKMTGKYRKPQANKPQYFDDDVVSLSDNEVLVDCGAFDGDSVISFVNELERTGGSYSKIYAFEADERNTEKMQENLSGYDNVNIVAKGVWDTVGELRFSNAGTTNSAIGEGETVIAVTTIDDTVGDDRVTFIKMDIEGSELKALQGAEKTIRSNRPRLAICVYHKPEDLITIPRYIKQLIPDYRLYMRNYSSAGVEAVIYAL